VLRLLRVQIWLPHAEAEEEVTEGEEVTAAAMEEVAAFMEVAALAALSVVA
jgi:hypothetical protein